MCVSVPFLRISRAPAIIGPVIFLRCHIFEISVFSSLYLLILLYSLTGKLLSVGTAISIKRHVFLL